MYSSHCSQARSILVVLYGRLLRIPTITTITGIQSLRKAQFWKTTEKLSAKDPFLHSSDALRMNCIRVKLSGCYFRGGHIHTQILEESFED